MLQNIRIGRAFLNTTAFNTGGGRILGAIMGASVRMQLHTLRSYYTDVMTNPSHQYEHDQMNQQQDPIELPQWENLGSIAVEEPMHIFVHHPEGNTAPGGPVWPLQNCDNLLEDNGAPGGAEWPLQNWHNLEPVSSASIQPAEAGPTEAAADGEEPNQINWVSLLSQGKKSLS